MSEAYVSNAVPYGGIFVDIYRDKNTPVLVISQVLLESLNVTHNAVIGKRPGVDGGDNGWWSVNGTREGSLTAQVATDATPTIHNGDFFSASLRRDTNGNAVNERFVINSPNINRGINDYFKITGNVMVDQFA
jgi:hypothetical protein